MATDTQELRFSAIESRLSRLEGIVEQMNLRLDSIERRLASLEAKVDRLFLFQVTMWVTLLAAIFFKKGG